VKDSPRRVNKEIAQYLELLLALGLLVFLVLLILLLALVLGLLGWLGRLRGRGRVGAAGAARALLEQEAEDVEKEEDADPVQVGEEALVVVEGQLVRHHLAYHVRDAHHHQELSVDEAHYYEQGGSAKVNGFTVLSVARPPSQCRGRSFRLRLFSLSYAYLWAAQFHSLFSLPFPSSFSLFLFFSFGARAE
jgi:hypothetical protein